MGVSLLVSVLDVVSASSPDPSILKVLGSLGPRAATAGQLTIATPSADTVDHPGAGNSVGEGGLLGC